MKLFVWEDPFHVRYGTSLYFAVAENTAQARQIAQMAGRHGLSAQHGTVEALAAEPTRVLDLPAGEWHTWEE